MTTLPPTTPEPPSPSPTETVVVDVTPELIQRLNEQQYSWFDWFYNNVATVGGALIALIAAAVAYVAIRRQIEADDKRHRRAERLAVVIEAYDLLAILNTPQKPDVTPGSGEQKRQARQERNFKVNSIATKLRLLGLGKEANAFVEFRDAVDSYGRRSHADGGMHTSRLYDHARRMLASAIEDQKIGPPPPSYTARLS